MGPSGEVPPRGPPCQPMHQQQYHPMHQQHLQHPGGPFPPQLLPSAYFRDMPQPPHPPAPRPPGRGGAGSVAGGYWGAVSGRQLQLAELENNGELLVSD